MGKVIWLSSYPKSGNTWMRFLLTNYLRDGTSPADINCRSLGPIASSRLWFDEWSGVEASALDDNLVDDLRPQALHRLVGETTETLYLKAHDAWRRNRRGESLFPPDITAGVIYLLRNPLDLVSSCAHHWGVDPEIAAANLCDAKFTIARSRESVGDQLRQSLYSWSMHVLSWIEQSGLPLLLVRYEDLRQNTQQTFSNVVKFLGLPADAHRIQKAIAYSDFAELQQQEARNGFRERPSKSSQPFFRRGEVGSWRKELAPALAAKIIGAHADVMRRFGYLDEAESIPLGKEELCHLN